MGGKRIFSLIWIAALTAAVVAAAQAGGGPGNSPAAGPGPAGDPGPGHGPKGDRPTILVKFVVDAADDELVQPDGDEAVGETKTKTKIIKLKKGASVEEKLAEYQERDDVVYAEENGTASAAIESPDDAFFGSQWALSTIHALDAWTIFPGSYAAPSGPPIAIVDSGVDASHPDLSGHVYTELGANCLSGVCDSDGAMDDFGHGTHVAGIAAAGTGDGVGVAGIAFQTAIIPVKVLDSAGNGSYAAVANGIIWAADQDAAVINVSLGSTAYSQTVCDAVAYALAEGSVVVAAAGNYGTSTPFYPAACPGAIGVAATDQSDTRASFSETGFPNVFVSAPGVNILSDLAGNSYKSDSGTSMAAPFVSAVADLLLGQNAGRTVADVKRQLAGSADKVGTVAYGSDPYGTCGCTWNASYGYGRINAYRALTDPPPAAAPDFALATSPLTLNVPRATSGKYTVSTTSDTGFASSVALSVTGLPSGATASFSPASIAGVGSSTLTVTVSTSTLYGSYPLTVKGTSGALARTTQVTLVVPSPDFTLKLSSTSGTIVQSEKATTAISLSNVAGFRSTVALSLSGAPVGVGVTTALSKTSISGTGISTLTVTTTTAAVPGIYELTVTGTSGALRHTAIYTFTVALAVPDFKLALTPVSSSVRYGRTTAITYKLTITPKYGFKGTVSFAADGIPPGTTGTWKAPTATITSTSSVYGYYVLSIPAGTPKSVSTVAFTVSSGGIAHGANATLTIS